MGLEENFLRVRTERDNARDIINSLLGAIQWLLTHPVCICDDNDVSWCSPSECTCGFGTKIQKLLSLLTEAEGVLNEPS